MTDNYQFPPIDRDSYKPIYIQVADMLIDYVDKLQLKPGDALPSENELLAMLDVSRNSIRQAVDRLVKMDFAIKRRGQGTFLKVREQSINLDVQHGFEGTLHKLGIETENILVKLSSPAPSMPWTKGLNAIVGEKNVHIRRVKKIQETIVALEDRILPDYIVDRYSHEELERTNVNPCLLDRYPDTLCDRFKYIFTAAPTLPDEAECLGIEPGTVLLQRIGEYFNRAGECFMHGRLVFVSNRFQVSYEFLNKDTHWQLS
jgi:GntR family transcriptional regulator